MRAYRFHVDLAHGPIIFSSSVLALDVALARGPVESQ
jgi:hypothetical protein